MKLVLYRNPGDKPFSLWDFLESARFYLSKIGYRESYADSDFTRLSKQLELKKDKT